MNSIIIKKVYKNIGWVSGVNFHNLETEKPVKLKSYNGCLCFMISGNRIGYKTWKQNAKECKIVIDNSLPF